MIRLKKATLDDCRFIYDIRNQEYVRVRFWHKGIMDYKEHEKWYGEHYKFYDIICDDDVRVGFVRVMDEEVSIALDETYARLGIGKQVLRLISTKHPYLKAVIRIDNLPSFYAFCDAGFKVTGFFMEKEGNWIIGNCAVCGGLVTELEGKVCGGCHKEYMAMKIDDDMTTVKKGKFKS